MDDAQRRELVVALAVVPARLLLRDALAAARRSHLATARLLARRAVELLADELLALIDRERTAM